MIDIFIVLFLVLGIYLYVWMHINFIKKNSISIKKIEEINKKYKFYHLENYNQEHIYDNEKFYEEISEEDYLIYQLQFIGSKVREQIGYAKYNQRYYEEYYNKVMDIFCGELGKYQKETKWFFVKILNYFEKSYIKTLIKKRYNDYFIVITLYLSDINGDIYRKKYRSFSSSEILSLIQRLNNKNGAFYKDRMIWDALCRVERGKVSNKMRFTVYKRDGYRCKYCYKTQDYVNLEVDHIIPIAKGGKSTLDNLQTLCHKCNVEKGDRIIK